MTVPLCHLTLRPGDTGAVDRKGHVIYEMRGLPCIGSLCAAWCDRSVVNDEGDTRPWGGCGLTDDSIIFLDPAKSTRQTTPKAKP